eukprot:CAMPEP_0203751202 /NCGR_PEP_ID=MMETSP0098-20131031/5311_1 /ASSEMBLY_ACC=CAM_ASM_000208 /TAXON_ID=96639 /ORGANISM=" , Strain NY0313808BC1" /LENGTH=1063 /DNA_ID=CAMNT_0050640811 /DNA_START=725 /DNA_END=3913 /DNA_ORIENTATION=-
MQLRKRYRRLSGKLSFSNAVSTFRKRKQYRWVTAKTKNADGLTSIYADARKQAVHTQPNAGHVRESSNILAILNGTEIFSWIPKDILTALSQRVEKLEIGAGESLYEKGVKLEPAYYIVVTGRIKVTLPGLPDFQVFADVAGPLGEVSFGLGESVTGLCVLIETILNLPTESLVSLVAEENTSLIKIDRPNCLEPMFAEFPGLQEELLQRILLRVNRVTLMSLFRFTGRVLMPASVEGENNPPRPDRNDLRDLDYAPKVLAAELGLELSEVLSECEFKFVGSDYDSSQKDKEVKEKIIVQLLEVDEGTDIIGFSNEPALYLVLSGGLDLMNGKRGDVDASKLEHHYGQGGAVGHLSLLTGGWAGWYLQQNSSGSVWVRSSTKTTLIQVDQNQYFALIDMFPKIIVHKAQQLVRSLDPIVRIIDLTTQWRHVRAGDVVIEKNTTPNMLYIVLHGNLRGIREKGGDTRYGRGDLLGEISFMTSEPSNQHVIAMRNTQLAAIPKATMGAIIYLDPRTVFYIARTKSLRALGDNRALKSRSSNPVICVVPTSSSARVGEFVHTLTCALRSMERSVRVLNSENVEQVAWERKMGIETVASKPESWLDQMVLMAMLNEAEDENDFVLYCPDNWYDPEPTWWSCLCVEQADLVLFVGNSTDDPERGFLEQQLSKVNTNARKELVILHVDNDPGGQYQRQERITNTREWITYRGGEISQHHHIRVHPHKVDDLGRTGQFDIFHYKSDFRRLARWLMGESIGLVLGGGGARGLAHASVLKCLEEQAIPIDYICGTSMGSWMSACYALHTDTLFMHKDVNVFASGMSSTWRKICDLTLPVTSYFSGVEFNRGIIDTFGDVKIEDLMIPYFCMTTDLTDSVEIAHRNGSLWRYVRASMSLVNFVPPICDVVEEGGREIVHYLADGGYMNNLPADVMRTLLGENGTVIAIDVQGAWKFAGYNYGDTLSGWKYLWMWLNPWIETPLIPTAGDIQTQLAFISSVKQGSVEPQTRSTKDSTYYKGYGGVNQVYNPTLRNHIDLYLYPPVDDYSTLDFHQIAEIQTASYQYAKIQIQEW